jgi:hypothetical protein
MVRTMPERPYLRLVVSNSRPHSAAGTSLAERLLDLAGCEPGLRVIEFTYGPSRLGWRLRAAGCQVVSVDLALTPWDALPDEWLRAFDAAVVACVLHQTPDPSALLAGVAACVTPGGVCAGFEPEVDALASPDLLATARSAGLSLVNVSEPAPNGALFWQGRVPALQAWPVQHLSLAA